MRFLTEDAQLFCLHQTGNVKIFPSQRLVTINGRQVLVRPDPRYKVIAGCANIGLTIKPCSLTISVTAGYSEFIRINGRPVCLDTVTGLTDGTPPATVQFIVRTPGQKLVHQR